jgi:hypothetical protein
MLCRKCKKDFPESEMQESHDIPKYMFLGDKNKADKCGRHWLCKKCHDIYEKIVPSIIMKELDSYHRFKCINAVNKFSNQYF